MPPRALPLQTGKVLAGCLLADLQVQVGRDEGDVGDRIDVLGPRSASHIGFREKVVELPAVRLLEGPVHQFHFGAIT